ncbi:MAG: M48 family peptidase, partial [Acholeplasmataceae bacterium]
FGKFKEIVLFDTLVDKLTTDEIIAVLAHEIAHGKFKDAWRMMFQQVLILGLYVAIIGFTVSSDALAQAFGLSGAHFGFGLLLFFILVEPIGLILSILTNHLSRVAEYRADRYAASMGYKDAMQNAFCKLARENFAQLTPHPLYVFFYYSHPSIPDRLEAIAAVSDA